MAERTVPSDHPMGMQSDDPKRWRALAVIAVAQLMIILDATIVNVALPTAGSRHLDGGSAVGGNCVHPDLRRPAAARRAHSGLHRAEAHVHHASDRVRPGLRARRPRSYRRLVVRRPRPAGRLRCGARSGGSVAHHGDVRGSEGAGPRVRRVRRDLRRGRGNRAGCRRSPDRVRLVALVPGCQHPDRAHHRRVRGL